MTPADHDLLIRIDENVGHLKDEILGSDDREGRLPAAEKSIIQHEKQLNFWRGALALLAFLFILAGSVGAWHIFSGERSPSASHARP